MGDLQEVQHKRVVTLSMSALVFAGYAIWSLASGLFPDGRFIGMDLAGGTLYILSCAVLMALAIVHILMQSFHDNRQIHHYAHHDMNTGLPNALAWRKCVSDEIRINAGRKGVWLCLVDVARLRAINDSFGIETGDAVIKELAARLGHIEAGTMRLFRLQGDVFGIQTFGPADSPEFQQLMDRIYELSRTPFQYGGKPIFLDVHLGAAHIASSTTGFEEAVHRAETALAASKRRESSWLVVYDENAGRSQRLENALMHDLREDLEAGRLDPAFQPLIGPDGKTVVGFEALARWDHAELGNVSPARFIPMTEELGMVNRLGEVMLTKACRQVRPMDGMVVSVNISPEHFLSSDFAYRVGAILEETGMAAKRLEIEITENVLIHDADKAIKTMAALRAMGVTIALDDFGTGYCGLSYLNRFEVDRIKIDQSFVQEIGNSVASRSIISTIIGLAGERGFGVTVEGVENEEQFSYLRQFNGLWFQGYFFARPLRLPELLASDLLETIDTDGFASELGNRAPLPAAALSA